MVNMSRLSTLLSLAVFAMVFLLSLRAMAGEIYEELDPSEISCGVKGREGREVDL